MSQEERRALAEIVRELRAEATVDGVFSFEAFGRGMERMAPDAWLSEHWCSQCGRPAGFGFGVSIQFGIEGEWRCLEHSGFAP